MQKVNTKTFYATLNSLAQDEGGPAIISDGDGNVQFWWADEMLAQIIHYRYLLNTDSPVCRPHYDLHNTTPDWL